MEAIKARIDRYPSHTKDLKLRIQHIEQIRFYIEVCSREGLHYGYKGHFVKREQDILTLLNELENGL